MTKIYIKIGIDQTVLIVECHTEVELSMDKILECSCSRIKIIEVILGKVISEKCKIIEVRILEVDIGVTLGMITLGNVEVGLEKYNTQITLGEMIEAAVDQDQVQDWVLIEIESDVLSVGNMIILPKTVQIYQIQKKNSWSQYSTCLT